MSPIGEFNNKFPEYYCLFIRAIINASAWRLIREKESNAACFGAVLSAIDNVCNFIICAVIDNYMEKSPNARFLLSSVKALQKRGILNSSI